MSELNNELLKLLKPRRPGEGQLGKSGYYDITALIKQGANVNLKDPESGNTALHLASYLERDSGVAKTLLKLGADINIQNNKGLTPLYMAINSFNIDAAESYIDFGADIGIQGDKGESAIKFIQRNYDIYTPRGKIASHAKQYLEDKEQEASFERSDGVEDAFGLGR